MMGDREKCIQAQMDEYLSKPLQQNQLIQTILKCVTLGGQLLEKTMDRDLPGIPETAAGTSTGAEGGVKLRPSLEGRALTSQEPLTGPSVDNPSPDPTDVLSIARTELSEMRSLTG
jgi:osomolarity two-component system, sensor histidine kinase NIK1